MKSTPLQITLAILAAAAAAQAAPPADPMANFYGNTATVAIPSAFYYARRYIDPDGTWREPHGSDWVRGVWRMEGGQVCSWQTEPAIQNPTHYCYAPVARQVGEEWTTHDPNTGALVIQAIEPGRE
jgi:hypothetical protein